jgi:hypothetical protein
VNHARAQSTGGAWAAYLLKLQLELGTRECGSLFADHCVDLDQHPRPALSRQVSVVVMVAIAAVVVVVVVAVNNVLLDARSSPG